MKIGWILAIWFASIDANATLNRHYTHIWCSKNLKFSDFSWFWVMFIKMWKFGFSDVRWWRHAKVYLEEPRVNWRILHFLHFFILPDGIFSSGFHWLLACPYGNKSVYQPLSCFTLCLSGDGTTMSTWKKIDDFHEFLKHGYDIKNLFILWYSMSVGSPLLAGTVITMSYLPFRVGA